MSDNPFEEPSTHNQRLLNTGGSRASYSGGAGGSGGYQPREVFGDSHIDAEGGNENYKPELQFQNFQHTSTQPANTRGTISRSGGGGAVIQQDPSTVVDFEDDSTGKQPLAGGSGGSGGEGNPPDGPSDQQPAADLPTGNAKFWQVEYYRPLFNVDTVEVLQRILRSLTPFRFGFIETAKANPDFYGPFWISTTLIFLVATSGNIYKLIRHYIEQGKNNNFNSTSDNSATYKDEWNYQMIVVGAAIIYAYTLLLPLLIWGAFKYMAVPVKFLEVVCIYGYTLFIFIPVSVILPFLAFSDLAQWLLTFIAVGWSGFFLVSNLLVTVKDIAFKRGLLAMVVVAAIHAALGLTYKLYFFRA